MGPGDPDRHADLKLAEAVGPKTTLGETTNNGWLSSPESTSLSEGLSLFCTMAMRVTLGPSLDPSDLGDHSFGQNEDVISSYARRSSIMETLLENQTSGCSNHQTRQHLHALLCLDISVGRDEMEYIK